MDLFSKKKSADRAPQKKRKKRRKTDSCCLVHRGQRLDSERHRRELEGMLHRDGSQKVGGLVTQADSTSDVEDEALELLGEWFYSCPC